jgi:recombination protein RecT
MATAIQPAERKVTALDRVRAYAEMDEVKKRFINLLGKEEGQAYVESIIIAVSRDDNLQKCTPKSIMLSAMRAASLKLSVDPIMEQAYLVAYGDQATLIPDYHGLVQLSVNTNYYKYAPEVSAVYVGEEVSTNRFTGEVTVTGKPTSDEVIGWLAYYEAKNGIRRWLYMTNEQCDAHGEKYNPRQFHSDKSVWAKERDKMRRKTCLRIFIKRYGNFSPVMQKFIMTDEAPIDADITDMPEEHELKAAPKFQQSKEANVSILTGNGNPEPVSEGTWADFTAWKERAVKVSYVLPIIDRATTTETDLRNYLIQIAPEITAAELDQPAEQGALL